jgi:hypothetical protein
MSSRGASEALEVLQQVTTRTPDQYKQAQELIAQIKSRFPNARASKSFAIDSAPAAAASTPEPVFPDDLVRRKLARDYPDDYVAQKGVYDMQVEAFEYMKGLPDSAIKRKVQRDYPNDFTAQKGVYDMQVEAKEQMQRRP